MVNGLKPIEKEAERKPILTHTTSLGAHTNKHLLGVYLKQLYKRSPG